MRRTRQGFYPLKISTKEYPDFSDRLKLAMHLRNCTVEELAESTYMTKSTIYGYRAGHRSPNVCALRLLAKELDVTSDFLIGLKEEIYI